MLALIPARGGSKGLPKKNVLKLGGKPLIAHTIEAALSSQTISRVIVSTDCHEIAGISSKYGAEVPFLRPASLALDSSPAIDTYIYTIDKLDEESGFKGKTEEIVVLLPTCPLRSANDIDLAVALFRTKEADSVLSFTKESHPVFWHKYLREDYRFENLFPDEIRNRQELRPTYYPNGSIYVFKVELLRKRSYYSKRSFAYVMPSERSVDIDDEFDFKFAKFLLGQESDS